MATNDLFNLEVSPKEDIKTTTERIRNIAGFLSRSDESDTLLSEDLVLNGLNIFISNILKLRIAPLAEELAEDKSLEGDINQYVETDERVALVAAFSALATNYNSHEKSAISFLEDDYLVRGMGPLWFDLKFVKLFTLTVKSLHNLSTEKVKRNKLLSVYPTVMTECIQTIKGLSDYPNYIEPYATFVANMTTSREARRLLLNPEEIDLFEEIFKYTDPAYPCELRRALSRIIKHLSADVVCHSYLLSETVNILPTILLPLAGNEVFDDDEYEKMPLELQYLDSAKTRDDDQEVRENLLAALLQLCRLKECRVKIRDSNAYLIMRELHKFEEKESMIDLVESVVDLLIRTEEEIGEKGDFVEFDVPPLEKWIKGEWEYPSEESSELEFTNKVER